MAKTLTKEEKEDFHRRLAELKRIFEEKKTLMSTYVPTPTDRAVVGRSFNLFNGYVKVTLTPEYSKGFLAHEAVVEVFLNENKEVVTVWRDTVLVPENTTIEAKAQFLFKLIKDHVAEQHLNKAITLSEQYDQRDKLNEALRYSIAKIAPTGFVRATSYLYDDRI